jgi:ABC-2 type transport system ATP-binding protein
MIEVRGITKRFGQVVAVDRVSFEVRRGEVLGLLGPNGAGKTTTMRILTCFLPPDEGEARVAGYNILEDSVEVRKRIGYLPETSPLYTDMGVLDYLNFVAEIRGIPRSQRRRRIKDVIEVCGLGDVIARSVGELSRGYCQRLGLSQVLIHDPEILILDEPTTGLDPKQIIEIRHLIKEIGREKTVILSTHILPEVSATCSRVLIIDNGRLVASGTPEELATQARGGDLIFISIRGPEADVRERLSQVSGVKEVRVLDGDGDGFVRFEVMTEVGKDLSEELFRVVVENHWSLKELRQETASLEEVFLHLTTGQQG